VAAASSPAWAGSGVLITPSGEVSVIPQIWRTWPPRRFSMREISAAVGAEPPTAMVRTEVSFAPVWSRWSATPTQMVGTPSRKVTPSAAISSATEGPSRARPGSTSLAPTRGAA
jgi:hypothetical protein